MTKQKTIFIDNKPSAIHIPEDLRMEAQRYADKHYMNFSQLVRYALSKLLMESR